MQKLLKQTTTGNIFVWTEQLASRADMVPHEPEAPAAQENPNENSETAQSDTAPGPGIEDAIDAFKREAGKTGRKTKQSPGEA